MITTRGRTVEVRRLVHAPPAAVFAVLTDPGAHPLIDGSGSLLGGERAGGDPAPTLVLGARFHVAMRRRPRSARAVDLVQAGVAVLVGGRMANTVVEYRRDRLLAWRNFGHHVWRYRLDPVSADGEAGEAGEATLVTETFDYGSNRAPWFLELAGFPAAARRSMIDTLDRLDHLLSGHRP